MKNPTAQINRVFGYDLLTERDAGNPVMILTGSPLYSVKYWTKLKELSEKVLKELEKLDANKEEIIQ